MRRRARTGRPCAAALQPPARGSALQPPARGSALQPLARGSALLLTACGAAWLLTGCGATPAPDLAPNPGPRPGPQIPSQETAQAAGQAPAPDTLRGLPPAPAARGGEPRLGPVDGEPPVRVPFLRGPLALRVQYPEERQRISVRDSNFLFGTVGTGGATLEIDGRRVAVEPNGAFLAWLPVPALPGADSAVYRLVARRGAEADSLRRVVLLPPEPYVGPPGTVWLDTAALLPPIERWLLPREALKLRVRGAPGLRVSFGVGSGGRELRETRRSPTVSEYRLRLRAARLLRLVGEGEDPAGGERSSRAGLDTVEVELVGAGESDTVRLRRLLPLRLLDPEDLPVAELREAPDSVNGASGVVVGRPTPYGPYAWRFPVGTRAAVEGRLGDRLRLRLAPDLAAWVGEEDARLLPEGTDAPRSPVGDVRVEPRSDGLVVRLDLDVPVPVQVEQPDDRTVRLTLYGAWGETERVSYGATDPWLESVQWAPGAGGRYGLTLRLRRPAWGYRVAYDLGGSPAGEREEGDRSPAGSARPELRVEVRRPPPIDAERPLRGRRIAVDPGHPGGGAHGPTGYYEGDANLAVARRLAGLLEREGAEAILVRDDTLPVGLYERTARAERAEAELFVSIHANALPDGVRPYGREGTSTYYYHPHSRALAASVQAGMRETLGLRDLGILWGDLAVVRASWMPSILTEGAFMMFPVHEAALRTPEFQLRYARGVLEGIRRFLGERATP
ncbi:MAG: N-acetylmuramoyl-L-alanine amidase [Gemmatimonadota bacterium]